MPSWKNSFERLSKHKYVAHIIHPKKVICICGKKIKLNRKWEEDYLDRHARRSGCKADEGQRSIYNWFKPAEGKQAEEQVEEEEEYDSDVYDNMDDDDLIQIDETTIEDQNQAFSAIETLNVNAKDPKKGIIVLVFVLQRYQNIFSELLHSLVVLVVLRLLHVNSFQIYFHRSLVGRN
jgi:hypothetical protein